jgi:hypothetical protein
MIYLSPAIVIGIVALPGPQELQHTQDGQGSHQIGPDEIHDGQSEEQDYDEYANRWHVSQNGNASFLCGK